MNVTTHMHRLKKARTDPRQHAETPQRLFDALHARCNFTVDAAASEANHKLTAWFGPGGMAPDFLSVEWRHHRVFLNPPFALSNAAIGKACEEWQRSRVPSVLLLPAKTAGPAMCVAVQEGGSLGVLPKRVQYVPAPGVVFSTANRDTMILTFGFGFDRLFVWREGV